MMKRINLSKIFVPAYRSLSLFLLAGIFIAAISYAFLVGFFFISRSWVMPLILSPTQERVLSYQPQVAALQNQIAQQKISLETYKMNYTAKSRQYNEISSLLGMDSRSSQSDAASLSQSSTQLNRAFAEKEATLRQIEALAGKSNFLLEQIDKEQRAGLIPKYDAYREKMSIAGSMSSVADAKAALIMAPISAVNALGGRVELQSKAEMLRIELDSAKQTLSALEESFAEGQRMLEVAKDSPYFAARKSPVTVAFVPYDNLDSATVGAPVYNCYIKVFLCYKVGTISEVYKAEEYAQHPIFRSDLKGRFINIRYTQKEAEKSNLAFIGGKPLFL